MGTRRSDRNRGPEEDPPGVEPMSLIPREIRELKLAAEKQEDRDFSPSPEEGTREERTREEEGTREEGTREVRMDDDDLSGR